jgi:hypothetical protein
MVTSAAWDGGRIWFTIFLDEFSVCVLRGVEFSRACGDAWYFVLCVVGENIYVCIYIYIYIYIKMYIFIYIYIYVYK